MNKHISNLKYSDTTLLIVNSILNYIIIKHSYFRSPSLILTCIPKEYMFL